MDKAETYKAALEAIRNICQTAKDEEGALRKIEQVVGFAFKKTGEEEGRIPAQGAPWPGEPLTYLLNLGNLQMDGVINNGVPIGRVWLNNTEVKCGGLDICIRSGELITFDLVGVQCGEQAEG
jgi:predicted RNase H-like HicB family nuclease